MTGSQPGKHWALCYPLGNSGASGDNHELAGRLPMRLDSFLQQCLTASVSKPRRWTVGLTQKGNFSESVMEGQGLKAL